MRNARQVKVINSQLEVLEELKEQLQSVFTYIDNAMQKGTSWIEETENTSFSEINHFLTNEISECFRKCLNLASNGNEESSQPISTCEEDKGIPSISVSGSTSASLTDKEIKKLTEQISVVEKIIAKQAKSLKTMKQKIKKQENETVELKKSKEDIERKNDLKIKEIMTELQAASNFMSELQTQNELLTNQMNENLKQQNALATNQVNEILKHQNELVEQKLNSFTKENVGKDDCGHTVEFDKINKRISENFERLKEITNQSGSMLTSIKDVEKKIEDVLLVVEQLKSSCQGNAEKDLKMKIGNVASQIKEIFSRISKIESTNSSIGFEAWAEDANIFCQGSEILTCFTDMIQDLDNNFDRDKGIYTVPVDGIYLCALFIEIDSFVKNEMFFYVNLKLSKEWKGKRVDDEVVVASCHAKFKDQTVSDVAFRKLNSGDKLFVKYNIPKGQNVKFSSYSHFTCVLLNPC